MFLFVAPAHAREACLDKDISARVAEVISSPSDFQPYSKIILQIKLSVAKGYIDGNLEPEMIRAVSEYYVRRNSKCEIPDDVRSSISRALTAVKLGGKRCDLGQYSKIVDRQYRALKVSEGYDVFQQIVKAQVAGNLILASRDVFEDRWADDVEYRDALIRTGLTLTVMQGQGCINVSDPLLDALWEFYKFDYNLEVSADAARP